MKAIGIIFTVLITIVISSIWRGYVFSKLWLWFVVSSFGAVPLGIVQSIGLAITVTFLTYQYNSYEDKSKSQAETLIRNLAIVFIAPALSLLAGAIVKMWL
jgi:hypothetical protein